MVYACGCWQHVLLGRLRTQSNYHFYGGLMGRGQPFYSDCTPGNLVVREGASAPFKVLAFSTSPWKQLPKPRPRSSPVMDLPGRSSFLPIAAMPRAAALEADPVPTIFRWPATADATWSHVPVPEAKHWRQAQPELLPLTRTL